MEQERQLFFLSTDAKEIAKILNISESDIEEFDGFGTCIYKAGRFEDFEGVTTTKVKVGFLSKLKKEGFVLGDDKYFSVPGYPDFRKPVNLYLTLVKMLDYVSEMFLSY